MLWENLLKIQNLYQFVDFPYRAFRKLNSINGQFKYFSTSITESDSENTRYVEFVQKASNDSKLFSKFRRNRNYREILEHVSYSQGLNYIDKYLKLGGSRTDLIRYLRKDNIGRPVKFYFKGYGFASPTTIRYFAVAQEISFLFGERGFCEITEIGCGFGGQSAVFAGNKGIKSYQFYDLPDVQNLINKFLRQMNINPRNMRFPSIYEIKSARTEFVLSNYAFSELPRQIQLEYLSNIISKSKAGYMIMNSGRSNKTGRSTGKLKVEEIMAFIPDCRILEEWPQTGPDNYLLVWGEDLNE
jgi:hypothetical protein